VAAHTTQHSKANPVAAAMAAVDDKALHPAMQIDYDECLACQ
jgi:hypothetical protein